MTYRDDVQSALADFVPRFAERFVGLTTAAEVEARLAAAFEEVLEELRQKWTPAAAIYCQDGE